MNKPDKYSLFDKKMHHALNSKPIQTKQNMREITKLTNHLESLKEEDETKVENRIFNRSVDEICDKIEEYFGCNEILGTRLTVRTAKACLRYLIKIGESEDPAPANRRDYQPGWNYDDYFVFASEGLNRYDLNIIYEKLNRGGSIRDIGKKGFEEIKKALEIE